MDTSFNVFKTNRSFLKFGAGGAALLTLRAVLVSSFASLYLFQVQWQTRGLSPTRVPSAS